MPLPATADRVNVEECLMPSNAASADRARIVRSLLSLAVVGTLLVATLVPLPGIHRRQKSASSPSVALRNWQRRIHLVQWEQAVEAAQQVRAKGRGFLSSDDVLEVAFARSEIEVNLRAEHGDADQQFDDTSRP
jgi:hypothetical protein